MTPMTSRRSFLTLAAAVPAIAQSARDWTNKQPVRYPDPDLVVLDPSFANYFIFNSAIYRHYVGCRWAEGPAWNAQGQYLVWSDIPNNRQLRHIEENGSVTTFRSPSNYSNGNTFDFEGRQLSCEHAGRRIVRYEHDGSVTVIADKYNGKRLNSPNDIVVHPDGGIWFTDPPYGIMGNYEGFKAAPENKDSVYRVDKSGRLELITDEIDKPNGLCFTPDYKKIYIASTGEPGGILLFDIADNKIRNRKVFTSQKGADGIRADTEGNIWAGVNAGVQIYSPAGKTVGLIRLPEICANVCFGGPKRNRLHGSQPEPLLGLCEHQGRSHFVRLTLQVL